MPHERPARSSLGFLGRPLNNFVQCARTPTAWPFTPAELFDFGVFTSTSEATPKFYVDYRLRAAGREPLPDDLRAVLKMVVDFQKAKGVLLGEWGFSAGAGRQDPYM